MTPRTNETSKAKPSSSIPKKGDEGTISKVALKEQNKRMARSSSQPAFMDKLVSQEREIRQILTKSKDPLNAVRHSSDGTVQLTEAKQD